MSPAPPPRPPRKGGGEPEHPAERGAGPSRPDKGASAGGPQRAGKFFEVRKGKSPDGKRADQDDEDEEPIGAVALPRSITQEQEQENLKKRLGREELLDIDKRHGAVKLVGAPSEAQPRKRSSGMWLLVVVVLLAGAAFAADRFKLLDKLKGQPAPPQAPPPK